MSAMKFRSSLYAFRQALCIITLSLVTISCSVDEPDPPIRQSVSLDSIFSDAMVIQRDKPIQFRGKANQKRALSFEFGGHQKTVQPDENGRWRISFPALPAGGPYNLVIEGTEVLSDILIGDVFLCSGQSNMEYPVYRALNPDRELSANHRENIRLITIPKATALNPEYNFDGNEKWVPANADTLRDFSAICYFTARSIDLDAAIPIGLIDASWGGTRIESWMSLESLNKTGLRNSDTELLETYKSNKSVGLKVFGDMWDSWWREQNPGKAEVWLKPEVYDWTDVPNFKSWTDWGLAEFENYNGQVWFKTDITLTEIQTNATHIELGSIDELDHVWINGKRVGTQFNWGGSRRYPTPATLLKPGLNSVVVNVASSWDNGGMIGPADAIKLTNDHDINVPLNNWVYKKASQAGLNAPIAPWESVSGITGIGNAMLGPLRDLNIAGGFWYQGESNAGDQYSYELLLNGLLQDWKTNFGDDTKMVVIQLPEFGSTNAAPTDSGWAKVREAQRQVALNSDDAALVVTLGAGDPFDIHPSNKQEVARRAADVAESLFYGIMNPDTNRDPIKAERSLHGITVTLSGDQALKTISSDYVIGLELCDVTLCQFALGKIESNTLVLSPPQGFTPRKVRYNWSDVPFGNLFDASDRPVGPFEIAIP